MSVYDLYKQKLVSADEAVKCVKSGDWVEYGFCICGPVDLDHALAKRKDELKDVKIRAGVTAYVPQVMKADPKGETFIWNSVHFSGVDRKISGEGRGWFLPMKYSELPRYVRENNVTNVFMVQVCPMDKHGYFNFSVSISHHYAVVEAIKKFGGKVIVEVNEKLPRVRGGFEECVHISQVDYIVEGSNTHPTQIPSIVATDVDKAVAKLVVEQLRDGDCIQLGIGGMPNAIGSMIAESDLKDLGVHTEMFVDAYVDMYNAGRITGAKKNFDKGRMVYAFAGGTDKTYEFLDENPVAAGAPVDYTNHPAVAEKLDNLVSINNAVEIDLYGQVGAESAGIKQISGTGGQLDFVQAAYASKGGRSFICMSSTFTDKQGNLKSRIIPTLAPGTIATDPRTATHIVVTEYGMVNLKGKTTWERAEALIGIAHPELRDGLIEDAKKMGIWRR